jgi:hypothetical protein
VKISSQFKLVLFATCFLVYFSGLGTWILGRWFQVDQGMGPEPLSAHLTLLHSHSVVSLWFLMVFGYLFHSHVLKGWKAKLKLQSGLVLLSPMVFLIVTVPFLFYLSDEAWKNRVAVMHTYVGLLLIVPFFVHLATKVGHRRTGEARAPRTRTRRIRPRSSSAPREKSHH